MKDLELEVKEAICPDKKKELDETTSSVKEYSVEIIIEKRDETVVPVNGTIISSKYLQIFKKEAYDIFCYLQMEYTLDNHSSVAKYSYNYHFLTYKQLIIARSQPKYREFIKDICGVNISKILPENDKFNDDIHYLLSRIKSNFERNHQFEQKWN